MKNWILSVGALFSVIFQLATFASTQPYAQVGILKSAADWEISVTLSNNVDGATAFAPEHYEINQGTLGLATIVEQNGVILIPASGLTENSSYTFTLRNFKDTNGNNLPPITLPLQTRTHSWTTIGANELGLQSQATAVGNNGFDIIDGGIQFFGTYDEGAFVYEQVTGDFDRVIRVAGQEAASRFARAGLMVRESLDAGKSRPIDPFDPAQAFSRYIEVHVNPAQSADGRAGNNLHEISFRPYTGGIGGGPGSEGSELIPIENNAAPQYPNAWLRIKREGSLFRIFRGDDGSNWIEIGNAMFPTVDSDGQPVAEFPNTVYVGAVYSPENGNISAGSGLRRSFLAQFRDYGSLGGTTPRLTIRKVGQDQVEVNWGGQGILESTDTLTNPNWRDVGIAPNPFVFTPVGTRFFRVRQ